MVLLLTMHMARMCGSNTTCRKTAIVDTLILFLQHTFSDGCGITSTCFCHTHTIVGYCWNLVVDQALVVLILTLPILAHQYFPMQQQLAVCTDLSVSVYIMLICSCCLLLAYSSSQVCCITVPTEGWKNFSSQ